MRALQIRPRDIRVGDLVEGRKVVALEPTTMGVVVARAGRKAWDLFAEDTLVDIHRPDRVAMQALVQATATL